VQIRKRPLAGYIKAGISYPGFLSGLLVFQIAWRMGGIGGIFDLGFGIEDLLYRFAL
jgi:hypothetical protein